MQILIVRPAPGSVTTAASVTAMGLVALVVPFFEVVPLAWRPPDPAVFDVVAMTSANAARYGGANLARFTHLPVFAVGEATAEAARSAGFAAVQAGAGDAADLGTLLQLPLPSREQQGQARPIEPPNFVDGLQPRAADEGKRLRVLHFAGADHRAIATSADVTVVPVYATKALPLSRPLQADIALIHSPRAGARLAELMPNRTSLQIVAISEAAARACGSGWAAIHIAQVPREHAMLECLRGLCEASLRT